MTLFKCRCGQLPELKNECTNGGHGCSYRNFWIECICGMATMRISDYDKEKFHKLEQIWNNNAELKFNNKDYRTKQIK